MVLVRVALAPRPRRAENDKTSFLSRTLLCCSIRPLSLPKATPSFVPSLSAACSQSAHLQVELPPLPLASRDDPESLGRSPLSHTPHSTSLASTARYVHSRCTTHTGPSARAREEEREKGHAVVRGGRARPRESVRRARGRSGEPKEDATCVLEGAGSGRLPLYRFARIGSSGGGASDAAPVLLSKHPFRSS